VRNVDQLQLHANRILSYFFLQ